MKQFLFKSEQSFISNEIDNPAEVVAVKIHGPSSRIAEEIR